MIKRRNILDLIGKHRGKYHSCVLTCYSFDFSFFEERVLPTLRLANIKNVNVLADGHYLEVAQETTTGKEFMHNKTYNFQPIYEKGVFHPKIMLLTGKKHGLLIIGSGNITSSGLSTNDEIWGAFHLDNVGNENAPIFGAVWNYLQPYLNKSLGFIPQKVEWMRQQSPWLEGIPATNEWINLKRLGMNLKFLGNTIQDSIFNQLTSHVPNHQVEELTIISPYYDRSGQQLKQLKEHFDPIIMQCIVDTNSGLLPSELDEVNASQIRFHNWVDCKNDYDETYNRLHAKLIHFKLKKEEYLLLGSANTTIAAMGSAENTAVNGEAGILIKRYLNKNTWIQELKIHIPDKTIEINQAPNHFLGDGSVSRTYYRYRILYAELRANEITVYLNKECKDVVEVTVLDRADFPIECSVKEIINDTLVVQVAAPDDTFKLTLQNDNDRISNYCIVHRLEALLKCNPDPTQEKLDSLLEKDFSNGDGITVLLQFVDYKWADEESDEAKKPLNFRAPVRSKSLSSVQIKEYEILKADEFNKISTESLLKQSVELSNSTVKIAEFLRLYSSGVLGNEGDFKESEEQKLFEDQEQQGEGDEAENTEKKLTQGNREKAAMMKYFKKLDEIYTRRLKRFYTTKAVTEVPLTPITIRSLASILIAIYLIQIKYGKKFTLFALNLNGPGETIFREEAYITSGNFGTSVETLKGFLLNVLGKFLLLSSAGTKDYEFEILNQKLIESQTQFLVNSTCLILNTFWRESEEDEKDILLLNCLYFSLGSHMLEDKVLSGFKSKLNNFQYRSDYIFPKFQDQLAFYKKQLLPGYLDWLRKFTDRESRRQFLIYPTCKLGKGNIIFNSKIGFNIVKKVVVTDESNYSLHLARPGYPLNNDEFTLSGIQLGNKIILYK